MGSGSSYFHDLGPYWETDEIHISIPDSDGVVVGSISIYKGETSDGSVRAQFELRFADKPSSVYYNGIGVDTARYASRREGVMVTLEPREGDTAPMRFSIYIPGEHSEAGVGVGNEEASTSAVLASRAAISQVRAGCRNTYGCDYPVCDLAENRGMRELADDRCSAVMVPLPS